MINAAGDRRDILHEAPRLEHRNDPNNATVARINDSVPHSSAQRAPTLQMNRRRPGCGASAQGLNMALQQSWPGTRDMHGKWRPRKLPCNEANSGLRFAVLVVRCRCCAAGSVGVYRTLPLAQAFKHAHASKHTCKTTLCALARCHSQWGYSSGKSWQDAPWQSATQPTASTVAVRSS